MISTSHGVRADCLRVVGNKGWACAPNEPIAWQLTRDRGERGSRRREGEQGRTRDPAAAERIKSLTACSVSGACAAMAERVAGTDRMSECGQRAVVDSAWGRRTAWLRGRCSSSSPLAVPRASRSSMAVRPPSPIVPRGLELCHHILLRRIGQVSVVSII